MNSTYFNTLSKKKKCSTCGNVYELKAFYKKKNGLHGRDSRCKRCVLQSKKQKYDQKNHKNLNQYEINETGIDLLDQNKDVFLKFVELVYE